MLGRSRNHLKMLAVAQVIRWTLVSAHVFLERKDDRKSINRLIYTTAALPHFKGLFDSSMFLVCGTNWEILYFIIVSRYNNGKCITEMGEFTLELGLLDFGASYTIVITNVSVSVTVTSSFCSTLWQCFCSYACDSHLPSAPWETWAVTIWR